MNTFKFKNLSDEQLVEQFQSTGNIQVFGEIYSRHYKKAYHTCLGIVKDRDIASDLVQDAMMKVLEALPQLKHAQLLGFWIYRISQNESIQFCKDRKKAGLTAMHENFDCVDDQSDKEAMEKKEQLLQGMEQVMEKMNENDRQFITLKYFDNLTVEDLKTKFGLSESAVKMRLARARARMEKLYNQELSLAL